ncbi:MAG: hypothetical protein ACFFBD_14245, partial [Candidatus Hodarchaeota archaeon]
MEGTTITAHTPFTSDRVENQLIDLISGIFNTRFSPSFEASLLNELEKLQSYYRSYRGELERKFGTISTAQFFCVIIGDRLRLGDLSYLFEICFTSLMQYASQVREILNTSVLFKTPQDIVSSLLQGATYLISAEIIKIGEVFAN